MREHPRSCEKPDAVVRRSHCRASLPFQHRNCHAGVAVANHGETDCISADSTIGAGCPRDLGRPSCLQEAIQQASVSIDTGLALGIPIYQAKG